MDQSQRFLFDDTDVRGEIVTLDLSYREVLSKHDYPQPVAQLLGEMLASAALLCSTLKFTGLLILQARSAGAVPLLMVECSSERQVRGMARYEADRVAADAGLQELMPDGVLTLTVDPEKGQRYQGIAALDGATLADCLGAYFATSEQLPTYFRLAADGCRARGMLLQQMPVDRQPDADSRAAQWQHVTTLADTLMAEELLGLDSETVLRRLYHQETVRVFDPLPLVFQCSCSRQRSGNALVGLGREDVERLLAEQAGTISIDCQFCHTRYLFDASDVAQLFNGAGTDIPSETRH